MHYGPEKSNDYRTHTSQFSLSMQPLGSGGQIYFETCELKNLNWFSGDTQVRMRRDVST